MLHFRIDLPDDAQEDLDRELNGVADLREREQITDAEAMEWARQAAQDAADKMRIEAEGPES